MKILNDLLQRVARLEKQSGLPKDWYYEFSSKSLIKASKILHDSGVKNIKASSEPTIFVDDTRTKILEIPAKIRFPNSFLTSKIISMVKKIDGEDISEKQALRALKNEDLGEMFSNLLLSQVKRGSINPYDFIVKVEAETETESLREGEYEIPKRDRNTRTEVWVEMEVGRRETSVDLQFVFYWKIK